MNLMVVMVGLIGLFGCAKGDTADSGDAGGEVDTEYLDEAEAAIDGYSSWDQLDPWIGIQDSTSVHGSYVQIWVNELAAQTIEDGTGAPMPVGAAIVKESYTDDAGSDVINTTAMYKASDEYGWYWGTWEEGEVVTSGKVSMCTDCHVAGQDYVLAFTW